MEEEEKAEHKRIARKVKKTQKKQGEKAEEKQTINEH